MFSVRFRNRHRTELLALSIGICIVLIGFLGFYIVETIILFAKTDTVLTNHIHLVEDSARFQHYTPPPTRSVTRTPRPSGVSASRTVPATPSVTRTSSKSPIPSKTPCYRAASCGSTGFGYATFPNGSIDQTRIIPCDTLNQLTVNTPNTIFKVGRGTTVNGYLLGRSDPDSIYAVYNNGANTFTFDPHIDISGYNFYTGVAINSNFTLCEVVETGDVSIMQKPSKTLAGHFSLPFPTDYGPFRAAWSIPTAQNNMVQTSFLGPGIEIQVFPGDRIQVAITFSIGNLGLRMDVGYDANDGRADQSYFSSNGLYSLSIICGKGLENCGSTGLNCLSAPVLRSKYIVGNQAGLDNLYSEKELTMSFMDPKELTAEFEVTGAIGTARCHPVLSYDARDIFQPISPQHEVGTDFCQEYYDCSAARCSSDDCGNDWEDIAASCTGTTNCNPNNCDSQGAFHGVPKAIPGVSRCSLPFTPPTKFIVKHYSAVATLVSTQRTPEQAAGFGSSIRAVPPYYVSGNQDVFDPLLKKYQSSMTFLGTPANFQQSFVVLAVDDTNWCDILPNPFGSFSMGCCASDLSYQPQTYVQQFSPYGSPPATIEFCPTPKP